MKYICIAYIALSFLSSGCTTSNSKTTGLPEASASENKEPFGKLPRQVTAEKIEEGIQVEVTKTDGKNQIRFLNLEAPNEIQRIVVQQFVDDTEELEEGEVKIVTINLYKAK